MFAKPWEQTPKQKAERAATETHAAERAKRNYSRSLSADVKKNLTKDTAAALAREYVKHGDMRLALLAVGLADEDASSAHITKMAIKYRNSKRFIEAYDHIIVTFDQHEILTRDRILAGLYVEASDRFGPTSAAARVTAWAKLAQLTGLEAAAKRAEDKTEEATGGVVLIPFTQSIEQWEQAAVAQQHKLKTDVRA